MLALTCTSCQNISMNNTGPELPKPISPVELAENNLNLARQLDAVHPLGATILSAFEHDVIAAQLDLETDEPVTEVSEPSGLNELLAADDLELLKQGLETRAKHSLSLLGNLGDSDPYHKDDRIRGRVYDKNGASAKQLFGSTLLVRRRSTTKGFAEEYGRVVFVGGLTKTYPNNVHRSVPPNPSVFTLSLRPFQINDEVWTWGNITGQDDVESLGQLPNCYFNEAGYYGVYEHSYGHARAYAFDLGTPLFKMPESQRLTDIEVTQPISKIDHLVKNAVEAHKIEARIRELQRAAPVN